MIKAIAPGEAIGKHCPMSMSNRLVLPGYDNEPDHFCVAQNCMAWSSRPDGKGRCGMVPQTIAESMEEIRGHPQLLKFMRATYALMSAINDADVKNQEGTDG